MRSAPIVAPSAARSPPLQQQTSRRPNCRRDRRRQAQPFAITRGQPRPNRDGCRARYARGRHRECPGNDGTMTVRSRASASRNGIQRGKPPKPARKPSFGPLPARQTRVAKPLISTENTRGSLIAFSGIAQDKPDPSPAAGQDQETTRARAAGSGDYRQLVVAVEWRRRRQFPFEGRCTLAPRVGAGYSPSAGNGGSKALIGGNGSSNRSISTRHS